MQGKHRLAIGTKNVREGFSRAGVAFRRIREPCIE
jgi:hypothetical protein